ncbi:MAG TPA: isoprenylcysteine carboxylmethyltransferase family protein [Anaerolineae bacterium]|nr:isoprenylcysteine carboxylmethyltransferase family protein [Anaerolineae bacterium]
MNNLSRWVGLVGASAAIGSLAIILFGLWRGARRPKGRSTGMAQWMLRWPFYLIIGLLFFGTCFLLWRPIPLSVTPLVDLLMLVLGALLYFPGLALVLWGRLTLGKMYDVSSSLGAHLYVDHQLIKHGPFAFVRHPMYLGIMMASFGGLLLYRMWTLLFLSIVFLGLILRAKREEQVLAAEFGEQWETYCQQVPAWFPRIWREDRKTTAEISGKET